MSYTILPVASNVRRAGQDPRRLEKIADEVIADMQTRNLPRLIVQLRHLFRYTDLKCPSISVEPAGLHAVFIDQDEFTGTVFIVFRKTMDSEISYQGFYPFGVPDRNIKLLSLYCAMWLTFENDRQFNQEWSMQKILAKYPDVTCLDNFEVLFQRFGFEVLGYSPMVLKPPYNIVTSVGQ